MSDDDTEARLESLEKRLDIQEPKFGTKKSAIGIFIFLVLAGGMFYYFFSNAP